MCIGAHVSIAGGIYNAPERAAVLGCECFQMFTRSPQGGAAPLLTDGVVAKFRAACAEHGQQLWVVHTPYYINLASPKARTRENSVRIIREELERASAIGARYVMTHLGSAREVGEERGRAYVVTGLTRVLDGYTGSAQFLIEISAGAGAIIGDTFEEIAEIIRAVEYNLPTPTTPPPRGRGRKEDEDSIDREAGEGKKFLPLHPGGGATRPAKPGWRSGRGGGVIDVCFDTQHAFASGYDLRTPEAVAKTMQQFDATIGLPRLKMSHVNDSKVKLGAHKDRHEHIGHGYIGIDGLRAFVQFVRSLALDNFPFILETEDGPERLEDMRLLRSFCKH